MIEFTEDAKSRFESYMQRLRRALRGTRAIEASEVEQNVREHVELALAAVEGPVGADRLSGILEQLGPPERWLLEGDRPTWRTFADRLLHGPEDWRLAYLSFALTTCMLLFFSSGGALLLLPAFIVSRACVSLMAQRNEPLDARRWLVLPPIVLMLLLFAAGALGSVIGIAGAVATDNDLTMYGIPRRGESSREMVAFAGYLTMVAGGWWILLSAILGFLFEPVRALFAPLLVRLKRRHLLALTVVGALLLGAGVWLRAIS